MNYKEAFNFGGKVALITGGASGIGKEFAKAFSECGAKIIIADINLQKAQEVANKLIGQGREAYSIKVDVSQISEIKKMVSDSIKKFGGIDILLNNAGINIRKLALEYNENEWDRIISTNLKGAFFVAQEVANKMIEQSKKGKIINTASDDAEIGHTTLSIYSASKAGLVALTKVLAKEWAEYHINVNSIGPGYLLTELTKKLLNDEKKYNFILNEIPLGRLGTPEDIAGAALFLASNLSNYITGQTIFVEGGRLVH